MSNRSISRRQLLHGAMALPILACGDNASDDDGGVDAPPAPAFPVPPLDDGELVGGVRVFRLRDPGSTGTAQWQFSNETSPLIL
jgi:hypothetical protein